MKVHCKEHGAHFPDEFEDTLKKGCTVWKDRNLTKLSKAQKRQVWDWMFAIDADAIWLSSGIALNISVIGVEVKEEEEWAKLIPEYEKLTEEQRKAIQKLVLREKYGRD